MKLFSIGEMSKIHGIAIKTLRYYDEIGLFKPACVNEDNGYRYYSPKQFESLNTILFLKYLGVPLKEIKGYLAIRSTEDYLSLLVKEQGIIDHKINTLMGMKQSINRQIQEITNLNSIGKMNMPRIEVREETTVWWHAAKIRTELELELALHELKRRMANQQPLVIGMVALTIPIEQLISGVYMPYNGVGILDDCEGGGFMSQLEKRNGNDSEPVERLTLPEGDYAIVYYRGTDHKASPEYYRALMNFIAESDYIAKGPALERVIINAYKTKDPNDYLTEIRIPVMKVQ